jgi:4-amino-4-deoxy-L-arabinose transferase-like glycosyltransferase
MENPAEPTLPPLANRSSTTSESTAQFQPLARRSRYRTPSFIFVAALLLRLAVITVGYTYRINPRGDHFQFGWEMGRIARSIALGEGFSSPTDLATGPSAWAPPMYPYILAGVFKVFGVYSAASAWVILAFNSVFGALTCVTICKIAEVLYGERVARGAAWTWALFPYEIYWPVRVVWETSLSTFLLSLALLLTLRMAAKSPPLRDWLGFGLLWGAIALTNTSLIAMLPLFLLWLWYHAPHRSRLLPGACLSLLAVALTIAPWLARNYSVFGKFVFVRDNLPLELYVANNDRSDGLWTRSEHPGNSAEAMQEFQQLGELPFMEREQLQFRQFVREHPQKFVGFTLERALYFWIGTPLNASFNGHSFVPLRHLGFFLHSALAFAGLWLSWHNRKRGAFLLTCLLLVYPLPYYLVNPFPRYKHPIEPVMTLLIVYFIIEIKNWRSTQPSASAE